VHWIREEGATADAVAEFTTLEPEVQVGTCASSSGFPFETVLHTGPDYTIPGVMD